MVSFSYQGGGAYNVYFADRMVVMSEAELEAIRNSDNSNNKIPTRDELLSEIDYLERTKQELVDTLWEVEQLHTKMKEMF